MTRERIGVWLVALGAASLACSSSSGGGGGSPEGPNGDDAATTGGDDSGSATDGAGVAPKDGSGGNPTDAAAAKPYVGIMSFSGTGSANVATAMFAAAGNIPTPPPCPSPGTQSGSCCFEPPAAPVDAGPIDAGTGSSAASAGKITVTDGTSTIATFTLGDAGTYPVVMTSTDPALKWKVGDMLKITAAGDTVHAFSGSILAPEPLQGLSPALSLTTYANIPVASALDVKWTAGPTGAKVDITISALTAAHMFAGFITCIVDDKGSASVPADLMGKLKATDTGTMSVSRVIAATPSCDNATITIVSDTGATGLVKFQ